MSLMGSAIMQTSAGSGSGIKLPNNVFLTIAGSGTVYSGLKIDADGNLYEWQPSGLVWSRFATWCAITANTGNYEVTRTVVNGSLTTDAGAGPLVLNTDRIYDIQSSFGEAFCSVHFSIAATAAPSTVLAENTYTFFAQSGFN